MFEIEKKKSIIVVILGTSMVNTILILIGIFVLLISIGICIRIIQINTIRNLQWQWYVMIIFITFFVVSYSIYPSLETNTKEIQLHSLLVSCIFFFGALFVLAILLISYQLIHALTKVAKENLESNVILKQKQTELEQTQQLVQHKNKELEKTLEDFYTIRLGINKDIQQGTYDEENKKIKDRIDQLKKL